MGRVSLVVNSVPPPELALGDRPLPRVSIFMSVFDCHVNRSPVAGRIERIAYTPGKFLNADLDKASEDNERNGLVVATANERHRRGADRGADRQAHRLLGQGSPNDRRGRAHRHDSLRLRVSMSISPSEQCRSCPSDKLRSAGENRHRGTRRCIGPHVSRRLKRATRVVDNGER